MPVAKDVQRTTPGSVHREPHPTSLPRSDASSRADADAHLLRLCLGLQLDAMLLTIGAAAAHDRGSSAPAPDTTGAPTAPPWHRWVTEDMDMVCTLAVDVMNRGAALPANLGSELDHAVPAAAVDNLIARYESMSTLLADVRQLVASDAPNPHRAQLETVLERCERRLAELRASRLEHTPPRGLTLSFQGEPSLRGEWLG